MIPFIRKEGGLRLRDPKEKRGTAREPLLSVVTVVRDMAGALETTIKSVAAQTYKNAEYIIIDGGSTDRTLDVIRRNDNKIDYWLSEPDEGISDAFNKGLRLCRGEIIGILNAGDWYEPDALAKAAAAYLQAGKAEAFIYGDTRLYEKGRPLFIWRGPRRLWEICFRMVYGHPSCFVTKSCYEKYGGFDASFKWAMDYELILRLYRNKVAFLYAGGLLANMPFGGCSDRHERGALLEVRKAQKKNHCGWYAPLFYCHFIACAIKRPLRRRLGRDNFILRLLRQAAGKA